MATFRGLKARRGFKERAESPGGQTLAARSSVLGSVSMKPTQKAARRRSSSKQQAPTLVPRDRLGRKTTLTDELKHFRGQLRAREAEAKALAARISALQRRIDSALSKLRRPHGEARRKEAHKRVSKT